MSATLEVARPPAHDRLAERLRGFGALGILATLVIPFAITPWIGALLALAWARWSRTPLSDLGYRRPRSWFWSTIAAVTLGIALKLLMKSIVMPLLGAEPVNRAYHYLAGNRSALPGMILPTQPSI